MSTPGPSPHDAETVPTAEELQRAIASVTGVTAAEVSRASNGRDRLRISLTPGEDPEAVAWSVAATLRERFGIALDPAAISARAIADPADDPVRVISRVDPSPDGRAAPTWPPPPPVTEGPALAAPAAPTTPPAPPERAEVADDAWRPGAEAREAAATSNGDGAPPSGPQPSPDLLAAARVALGAVPGPTTPATAAPTAPATPATPATPAAPTVSGPMAPLRSRAAISELSALPIGDELDVTASLRLSGREVVGRARGVRTRRGRWRAISEATLDALGSLSAERVRGHIDHVTVLSFADLAHVSVSVTLLTERGEETFLGAALVRDDPDRAVMRATLDAVNRRVEPWLAGTAVTDVS
jgi:hypothetical protein